MNKSIIKKIFRVEDKITFTDRFDVYWSIPYDVHHHVAVAQEALALYDDDYMAHYLAEAIAGEIKAQLMSEIKQMQAAGQIQKIHPGGMVNADLEPKDPWSDIVPNSLSEKLPGLRTKVLCPDPDNCFVSGFKSKPNFLRSVIIHLNDRHKWTREQIADWLETLDIDLTFKEVENED